MATELNNMYLASGGTLALAFGTSATKVYGSVDADKITIAAGVTVVLDGSFNRGNDTIQFTGNAASYSVVRVNASTVRITDAAGTSVTIPVGSAGTQIQFADATRTLSGSSAGIVLGDQAVSSTAAALAQGTSPAGEFILTSSAPTVAEGSNGTKTLTYLLQLNKAPTSELSLNYQTTDAGTAKAGDDFQVVAGLVTFAPGQTAATVSVTVYGDTVVEADETVVLRVSGSKLVASVDAAGTIVNDDAAPVDPSSFTVSAGDIASANASSVPVTVNVGETGNKTVTIQSDGASASRGVIINGNANATITSGAAGDTITVSGNGNNTINSGAGNDTVNIYGTGTNTINVGAGTDTVLGGSGNDTIVFAAGQLRADDVVDGGAGIDTVRVSGDGNVIGTGLTNIENIVFDGTEVSISAAALRDLIEGGLKSISGSSATTELTITGLSSTLDLSKVTITGGLEKIITNGTGTLVLNTTQVGQIAEVTAASGTLTRAVVVPDVQTVASADALIAAGVNAKFTLEDTAANLAQASVAVFNNAQSIKATTVATAAQAEAIAAIDFNSGFTASSTNFKVSVTDTAEQLATRSNGLGNATKVTATTDATVAEANAIKTAADGGNVTTTIAYALADTVAALNGDSGVLLTGATAVRVTGTVTDLAVLKSVNDKIGTAADGKNVVAGYAVNDSYADLTDSTYAAEVAAAGNIVVSGALSVSQANAIEALDNSGKNTYTLTDTATALLAANPSVVANAAASNAVTVGDGNTTVTVAQMNGLAAKYSNTAMTYAGKVVDTAAEIVKLTTAARTEVSDSGDILITENSTATVAELLALNTYLTVNGTRITAAPSKSSVKISDTAANLDAAVKVPTTLSELELTGSVTVTGVATVKQITDINADLARANTNLNAVAAGYTLQDTADALEAAGTTVLDNATKVTVTTNATVDQIDTIVDGVYGTGTTFVATDLGSKITYALRDTAAAILAGTVTGGNGGSLAQYRVGASSISITDSSVGVSEAKALLALRADTKFDGVYSIRDNVSELNAKYAETGAGQGREAIQSAAKVTLVDSVALLSDAAGDTARGRATITIARDSLTNLTSASSSFKNGVGGFELTGAVVVTAGADVDAVNALSAIKPTVYSVASAAYADIMAGNATFLANAATVNVSGNVTVAQAAALVAKTGASVSYNIVDTAANLANASSSILANDANGALIDTSAASKLVVTVAQADILFARGITGFTISDTAANISNAVLARLQAADANEGTQDNGLGITVNDGNYATLTVAKATEVYGTNGYAAGKYDLVDTAANLAGGAATAGLVGFARNVTATTAANAAEANNIANKEPKGTLTFDVTASAFDLLNGAGINSARNVTVTSAGATLAQAKSLIDATNSGSLTYKLVDAGSTLAADLASTNAATRAAAVAAVNGATTVEATGTVTGVQAATLSALDKVIAYSISDNNAGMSDTKVTSAALNEATDITVTDGVSATLAATILAATNAGTVTLAAVSGTSAQLAALVRSSVDVVTQATATTFSTVAEAVAIRTLATNKTYGLTDTAANLAAASDTVLNGAVVIGSGANNIIATTSATAAEAIRLEAATGTAKFAIADTFSNLMANSDVSSDVDADAAMTLATKVTVTDGPITLAQAKDLVAVDATSLTKYVYSIADRDAAIANLLIDQASITDDDTLFNAAKVTGENGAVISLGKVGSTIYVVGTKAELSALSSEFKSSSVAKIVTADVATLNADPLYFGALPVGTSLRITDNFSNLAAGNALVRTALSVVVTGAISVADWSTVNGWSATQKVYDLSDTATALAGNTSALNSAANVTATGTATYTQAQAIVNATNAASVTIAAASMNASDADAMTYGTGDKITSLTVTGNASMSQAGAVRTDITNGKVGSATYSVSDTGANVGASSTTNSAATAIRNGATDITTTSGTTITGAEAQRVLSATNTGKTTVASITDTPANIAKLVADGNDTITQITVNGDAANGVVATVAEAQAIAALDARTGTAVTYNFVIVDTADAILAAPLSLLDAVNSVTVKGAVSVATAGQLLALDTADTTIDVSLQISDTVAALKAAPTAVSGSSLVTKVTVADVAKVADITAIDTAFTAVSASDGKMVYDLKDTYSALGANTTVSNGATQVTVDGTISVGQAQVAYGWTGTATYSISASALSVAASYNTAHVKAATSVALTGAATVDQAKSLSEMTNLAAGFTIKDTAAAIYNAYNAVNGANASDFETIIAAKSISLSDDATVAQLTGSSTATGISALLAAYTIYDNGNAIASALAKPATAALVQNATEVALAGATPVGMTVESYQAIKAAFGTRYIGHDSDRSNPADNEGTYSIDDSFTNVLVADEAIIADALKVSVSGTSAANTIDMSSVGRGLVISGGAGIDTVTVTGGADRIALHSADTLDRDVINQFSFGSDKIVLDDDIFAGLGTGTGDIYSGGLALAAYGEGATLAAAKTNSTLTSGAAILAVTSGSDTLIYYDTDVTDVSNAVLIATLQGVAIADLGAGNFVVIG
jgi:hypothetical protein